MEGKTISQWSPQHGLHLTNQSLPGGITGQTSPSIGPPRKVEVVKVDKAKCLRVGGATGVGPDFLARTTFHELGHAIGWEKSRTSHHVARATRPSRLERR